MYNNVTNVKTIVIGLDGASLDTIQSLINQHKLPFFQKMIRKGSFGNLKSSLPVNGAASWASFFSGKNPGKHNIYDFISFNGSLEKPNTIKNSSIKSDLIWHIANQNSLKTILFNIPIVSQPEKVNGIMVTGLATDKDQTFAYPESVYHELLDQNYKVDSGPQGRIEQDQYYNQINEVFIKQSDSFFQLINNHSWDLAIATFNTLNRVQQFFSNDEKKIESFFVQFDAYLQKIFDSIDEEINFILLSNYGFKSISKKFFVNEWLSEMGFLKKKISTKQSRITDIDKILFNYSNNGVPYITKLLTKTGITKKNIRSILPNIISETLKKTVPMSIKKIFHREYLDIEWKKTQAYFVSENVQGININLKGREPLGVVEPGTEYERLRDKIISELYHFKDPYTFENIVEEVYRKEEIFNGEYVSAAPDIVIIPANNNYYLDSNKRTSRHVVGSAKDEYPVYGQKDRNGVFFISGPKVEQGKKVSNITIFDIAPTILHLFGIEKDISMDGQVISDIFSENDKDMLNNRPKFIPAEDLSSFVSDEYLNNKTKLSMNSV